MKTVIENMIQKKTRRYIKPSKAKIQAENPFKWKLNHSPSQVKLPNRQNIVSFNMQSQK